MPAALPPRWKDLETDERFGKLNATQRLGVFNKWLTDASAYGTENGWWDDEEKRTQFSSLVKTKLPTLSQAAVEEGQVSPFEDIGAATSRAGVGLSGTPYRANQLATDALLSVSKAIDYVPGLVADGLNKAFGTELKVDSWLTNQLRNVSKANQASLDELQKKSQELGGGEVGEMGEALGAATGDAIVDVGAALLSGGATAPSTIAKRAPGVVKGALDDLAENFLGPSGRQLRIASTMGAGRSYSGTWNNAIQEYTDLGYSREEAEAKAVPEALNAGASTYLITMLGGKTGIESVLKNSGAQGLKGRLREVITEAAAEGLEEGADQTLQDLNERFIRNPDKAVNDSFKEIKYAVGLGSLLGGGFSAVGQTVEKLRESGAEETAYALENNAWWESPEKTSQKVTEIKAQLDKDFGPDEDDRIDEQIDLLEEQDGTTDTATTETQPQPPAAGETVALPPQRMGVQTLPDDTETAPVVDENADVFANVPRRPATTAPAEPVVGTATATLDGPVVEQPPDVRARVIASGIPDEAADNYIANLRNEGLSDDQILEIADNNRAMREEANRKNAEAAAAQADVARRARNGDPEARAQLERERGVNVTPQPSVAPTPTPVSSTPALSDTAVTEPPVNVLPTGDEVALPPQRMATQEIADDTNTAPEVDETADVFAGVQRQPEASTPAPQPEVNEVQGQQPSEPESAPANESANPFEQSGAVVTGTGGVPTDPNRLDATTLEQKNPLGLRVAAKAPSGEVVVGKTGEAHFNLEYPEGSDLGFVDKDGNYLTRAEAAKAQTQALSGASTPPTATPASSASGVTTTQPASQQPATPPVAPAPTPDAQAFEDSLVEEARSAGTNVTGRTSLQIKEAIQGKGWYPKSESNPKGNINRTIAEIKDRVRQRREAEATNQGTTAPQPAVNLPEGATDLIQEGRKTKSVPTSRTINSRYGNLDVEQRRTVRREAVRRVAGDLGITYSEELDFTKDSDGNDSIPIRVTENSTEPVFVNDPVITAKQLDVGFTPVVPEAQRGNVVRGIEFDPDTGRVTSAFASGVTTTQPGQYSQALRAQRPGTAIEKPLTKPADAKREKAALKKFNDEDKAEYEVVRQRLENMTPRSPQIAARFSQADMVAKALSKWAHQRALDKRRAKGQRKNYTASQVWNFTMREAGEDLKTLPMQVSLDAPVNETSGATRGENLADEADTDTDTDTEDRGVFSAAAEEADTIEEGVAKDEVTEGGADTRRRSGTGMTYTQAFNIANNPRMLADAPPGEATDNLRAEAQELLAAAEPLIETLDNDDVDYWGFKIEDFQNVDVGNPGTIISASRQAKSPYIDQQRSWFEDVARAMGVRRANSLTPEQHGILARYFADKYRPFFEDGNTTLPVDAVGQDLPELQSRMTSTDGAASAYRAVVDRLKAEFPGAKVVYSTAHDASAWYDPRYRTSLFVNPLLLEQELDGLTESEATPFLRALLNEEYIHFGESETIPRKLVIEIARRLSARVRKRVIDTYVPVASYADPAERQRVVDGLSEYTIGSEYMRMLIQELRDGRSTESLAPEKLPQDILQQIIEAIRALARRLRARLEVARDPVLAHAINALNSGLRVLELQSRTGGALSQADLQPMFARPRAKKKEADPDVFDIDDIDNMLPPGNGWLRPDGSWVAAETISAGDQIQGWEAEMGRFGGHEAAAMEFLSINDPNAYALLQDQLNRPDAFERGYEVVTDYMRKLGWLRVVQEDTDRIVFNGVANKEQERALFMSAIADEKSLVADNGRRTETLYEPPTDVRFARPGNRIRGRKVGAPVRGKGGIWSNIKAIVTGDYSSTKSRTGGWFSSGKQTPYERDILQKPQRKIAADADAAEFAVQELRRAVKEVYGKGEVPTTTINRALGSTENPLTDTQVAELRKIRNKEEREAKKAEFKSANKEAARAQRLVELNSLPKRVADALERMREKIDSLSRSMVEGGYIPESLIPVFDENMEVYLHREYLIFQNPEWKENMLNPKTEEQVRIRAAAERLFVDRAIAEEAVRLRRIAKEQGQPISKDEAKKRAKADVELIARRAEDLALQYLSVADENSRMFFMGSQPPGKRNLSIIKVRGQIPKEIREFWGEINDAETNFVQTVAKMSAFMAQHDAATELLQHGIENGYIWKRDYDNRSVFNGQTRKWDVILAGKRQEGFPTKEDAEKWRLAEVPKVQDQLMSPVIPAGYVPLVKSGLANPKAIEPLNDAYGPPDLAEALAQMNSPKESSGFYRGVSFLTALFMTMKTVGYFPQAFVRNFLSNPIGQLISGGINLENWGNMTAALREGTRAARLGAGLRGAMKNVEPTQELREKALRLGVLNDNPRGTMLKDLYDKGIEGQTIQELLQQKEFKTIGEKIGVKSAQTINALFQKMAAIYNGIDDQWKMFGWIMEMQNQRRAHPDWTQEQIEQKAAENIRDMVWTYSMSPEITKRTRRIPVFAPFITWTSEVLRATSNAVGIANEEIRIGKETGNRAMVRNGTHRRAGQIAAFLIIPSVAAAMRHILGYDDEDEEAIRTMLPDWQKNAQIVLLPRKDDGKQLLVDLSYLDPLQIFKEPLIAMLRAFRAGKDAFGILTAGFTEALKPVFSEQLFAGAMFDISRNQTADGRRIWNPTDTAASKTSAMLWHVAEKGGPGTLVGTAPRIYKAATGEVSPSGRSFNLAAEVAAPITGQRIQEVDAQTSLRQAVSRFKSLDADSTQLLSNYMTSRGTVNPENIPGYYENANRAKRENFEELLKVYKAAILVGTPENIARQTLMGMGRDTGLSREDAAMIIRGAYQNWRPSRQMMDLAVTRDGGRERIKALMEHLREVNQQQRN